MSIQSPLPQGGINEIVVSTVFLLLAILAVVARFYARFLQRKALSIDDYLIVVGLVFTIATVGVGYALVLNAGAGLHIENATPGQNALELKLFVPAPLLWALATFFVKLSILFFYISIFTMPRIRTAVFTVIALSVALIVAVIFESFLLCRPFAYTWDKTIPNGACGSSTEAYLAISIVNLIIDLSLVVLPMPVLWRLQMPVEKKISISAILALGLLVCALTAVRVNSVLDLDPQDFTYTVVPDLIFGALEIELGIVNACLPILRPVVRKAFSSKSTIERDWLLKQQRFGNRSNGRKGRDLIGKRSPDNKYSLGEAVPEMLSSETKYQAHVDALYNLESGGLQSSGSITERRDLCIPTQDSHESSFHGDMRAEL